MKCLYDVLISYTYCSVHAPINLAIRQSFVQSVGCCSLSIMYSYLLYLLMYLPTTPTNLLMYEGIIRYECSYRSIRARMGNVGACDDMRDALFGRRTVSSLAGFGYVACTCTALCAWDGSRGLCRKAASGCERTDGTRKVFALRATGPWARHAFDTEDIEQIETCTRRRDSYKNWGGARARRLKKLPSKEKKEKGGKRKDVISKRCGKKKQRKRLC